MVCYADRRPRPAEVETAMRSLVTDELAARPRMAPAEPAPHTGAGVAKPVRLTSLDAYRGFIMLAMVSAGFGLAQVAKHFQGDPVWGFIAYQTDHVEWAGCGFWDLIQPAFMFMAGVAVPFAYVSRKNKGESDGKILCHVAIRSLALVLLGFFLSSTGSQPPGHLLVNVLTQIGLGYFFVYLLRGRGVGVQLAALTAVLCGYWLWFACFPLPPERFQYETVGVTGSVGKLEGFFAHWNKNTNAAAFFDRWLMNLLPAYPSDKPFEYNREGYPTLNFIPSMGTMILGLMAGELLRGPRSGLHKLVVLVGSGFVCLVLGLAADWTVCPIVKKIWTPSWTLFSGGLVLWMLAAFYGVMDLRGWKSWAFPLTVVGMNSIAIYCLAQLIKAPIRNTFTNLFGKWWFEGGPLPDWAGDLTKSFTNLFGKWWFEGVYGPIFQNAVIVVVLWLACWVLYRRKIFLKV
jgi:predicted acyltransferase